MTNPVRWSLALSLVLIAGCGGAPGAYGGGGKTSADEGQGGEESASGAGGETTESGAGEAPAQAKVSAPPVGTKQLEERKVELSFELTLNKSGAAGGMQSGSWSIDEERSLEVLGSKQGRIEKLKVVFGRREAKPLLGVEQHTATAGKSYVLDASSGPVAVTHADGSSVSGEERDAMTSEYGAWVGEPSPLLSWLGGGSLKAGEKREATPAQAEALLGALPAVDAQQTKLEVVSKGSSGGKLELDVHAQLKLSSNDTHFALDLSGPARIDQKTGFVTALDLKGPVKASGTVKHKKKGTFNVGGKGKATLTRKTL